MNKKNTTFLNSLYMDFLIENKLGLFLKSLDEIWTAELYTNLKQNLWLYLLSTTFLISLMLSGYHFGIENNFFPEFSGCSASNLNITNKEDLLKSLNEIIPNCKDVTFKILGFSLATINVLISGLIMIISMVILKYEKNR